MALQQSPSRLAGSTSRTSLSADNESRVQQQQSEDGTARPLTPLSYLSSPVADLASTLHTVGTAASNFAERRYNAQQAAFLSADHARDSQSGNERSTYNNAGTGGGSGQTPADRTAAAIDALDDLSRQQRLQRVLTRLYRMSDTTNAAPSSASAYSNRTPSPNRQSLYDWAPSAFEQGSTGQSELDDILAELRRQPLFNAETIRVLQRQSRRRELADGAASPGLSASGDRRERHRDARTDNPEQSLRNRALLQRHRESARQAERTFGSGTAEEHERGGSGDRMRTQTYGRTSIVTGAGRDLQARSSSQSLSSSRTSSLSPGSWPLPFSSDAQGQTARDWSDYPTYRMMQGESHRRPRVALPQGVGSSSVGSSASPFLENSLKYLDDLRSCTNDHESLSAAMDHNIVTREIFSNKHDFVMDLSELDPFAWTSWLQPGTLFCGHQHASNGLTPTRTSASGVTVEQINPNFRPRASASASTSGPLFDHPPGSTRVSSYDMSQRAWLAHQFPPLGTIGALPPYSKPSDPPPYDQWPVRVIIHAFDPERMVIQGTMEAYDVPQNSPTTISSTSCYGTGHDPRPKAGKKSAPIRTYLEGHIIDLRTHSFLTPSSHSQGQQRGSPPPPLQPTNPENATPYTTLNRDITFPSAETKIDAANWRKLPPFSTLCSSSGASSSGSSSIATAADDEMARILLSKSRMHAIHQEYVFMRWKERCFVHAHGEKCADAEHAAGDQDRGHGLTISGFYYVSLRRSDGLVEGLYYDPSSTPYQHLRLQGTRTGWPAFEFR